MCGVWLLSLGFFYYRQTNLCYSLSSKPNKNSSSLSIASNQMSAMTPWRIYMLLISPLKIVIAQCVSA